MGSTTSSQKLSNENKIKIKSELKALLKKKLKNRSSEISKKKSDKRKVSDFKETVKKTLIWTAATLDQGGIGHINCKNKQDWADKISEAGLVRNFEKEKQLQNFAEQGYHMGWFKNNILYFERPIKDTKNWDI